MQFTYAVRRMHTKIMFDKRVPNKTSLSKINITQSAAAVSER